MDNQLAVREESYMNKLVLKGDLSSLSEPELLAYHKHLCDRIGVPEALRPFNLMNTKQGKFFYANKTFTDWVRKQQGISFTKVDREIVDDIVITTVTAIDKAGRMDVAVGAVPLYVAAQNQKGEHIRIPLSPDDRANAIMKSETKGKRRVTLSMGGYGFSDESEIDTIPSITIEPLMIDTDKPEKALVAKYVMLHKKARSEGKDIPFLPIEQSTKADFIAAIESLENSSYANL